MDNYTSFPLEKQKELRALRYKRLSISRNLAIKYTGHSNEKCMWTSRGSISINYSEKDHKAFFKGLVTCGSVWDCPVCSAKIMARRSEELELGLENWFKMGGAVCMVTYTLRHNYDDKLKDLAKVMTNAIRFVQSGAPWVRTKEKYGIKGSVISEEVLLNKQNGWHYHKHQVLFLKPGASKNELSNWIYARYERYLESQGYDSVAGVGVDVSEITTDRGKLPEYLTKLSKELTASDFKDGAGLTPWELLDNPDLHYKYVEYSKAMYGKRKLVWSRGLRKLLEVGQELSDEAIAMEDDLQEEGVVVFKVINCEEWNFIRSHNLVCKCLEEAEKGYSSFYDWFEENIKLKIKIWM